MPTLKEAKELVELCQEQEVTLAINENYPCLPWYRAMREAGMRYGLYPIDI